MALVENPTEHFIVQSIVNASKRILGRSVKPKESMSTDIVQSIALFYFTSVPSLAEPIFLFVLPENIIITYFEYEAGTGVLQYRDQQTSTRQKFHIKARSHNPF